ncbi:hypothetical protein COO91_11107 (plasmid) [Nostoc flagelliforme CCNUN1]|uniref:Uncharacterized protein n=1 Tax=Nostoc flagelliforme CCNUN1 TaxID=2038116 RepID=A0A2K8TB20_9NOSO|nr:hypothetical protein COO91_11107 [Nostoc flagelliforme CCNUN1]
MVNAREFAVKNFAYELKTYPNGRIMAKKRNFRKLAKLWHLNGIPMANFWQN